MLCTQGKKGIVWGQSMSSINNNMWKTHNVSCGREIYKGSISADATNTERREMSLCYPQILALY